MDERERNQPGPKTASPEETTAFDSFYNTPLGQVVQQLISRKLMTILADTPHAEADPTLAAGVGYAHPFLRFLDKRHGAVIGLQSAGSTRSLQRLFPGARPSRLAKRRRTRPAAVILDT